jgi:DNA (cytosine-5)-methyltransferase 1
VEKNGIKNNIKHLEGRNEKTYSFGNCLHGMLHFWNTNRLCVVRNFYVVNRVDSVKFIDLFAGIGGFSLGLERAGMQCVGQVEIDKFCNKVLEKHWPNVKRIGDIKNVRGNEFGTVELICGGVPCQPASCAGKRKGTEDDRWLWPEAIRFVREAKPTWVLFENVCGLLTLKDGMVFESLLSRLETEGYEVQTFVIPACAVNAPHRRNRVWIIANNKSLLDRRYNRKKEERPFQKPGIGTCKESASDANITRLQGHWKYDECSRKQLAWSENWKRNWPEVASELCRMDDGVSKKLDRTKRLKALGNSVVPQIVEVIGRAILQIENFTEEHQ